MKSAILYRLYTRKGWKKITKTILRNTNGQDLFVLIVFDLYNFYLIPFVFFYIKREYKALDVEIIINNSKIGEAKELHSFLKKKINSYSSIIYLHSKGVTKSSDYIHDWVKLMCYFLLEREDLLIEKFQEGYALYGVNLGIYKGGKRYGPYQFSDFHYSGNFVAVNLNLLRDKIKTTPVDKDYFGVEGYWGKLCDISLAYNAHDSSKHIKNHYKEPYPEHLYRDNI